jgi:hypothetical protein
MRRVLCSLLSAVVLLAIASFARAADDDAKAILAKAIKAHGGEETLTKYQAAQGKNKGTIKIAGVGEVEFTEEVSYQLPDKFKEKLEIEVGGRKVNILTIANGDKASIKANGKAVDVTDAIKQNLKDAQYVLKISRMVPLIKDKGYELATLGEVKVEDKPTVGVRISSKGQKDISLYFDKETGLLAKAEHRSVDPDSGKEITEERIVLEYQKKDGVSVPKKLLVKHDGEKFMEAEVIEMKMLEKLDDSEFE